MGSTSRDIDRGRRCHIIYFPIENDFIVKHIFRRDDQPYLIVLGMAMYFGIWLRRRFKIFNEMGSDMKRCILQDFLV
jgi:hypothetical protein